MGNGNLKDNWSVRSRIRLQGTSSLEYISSAGNFDINFRDDIKYKHTDGLYYTKSELIENQYYTQEQLNEMHVFDDTYSMTDDSVPVNYFNVKVNVASSENANNSQLADWFNTHNPFKRAVKVNGVRDTMEFHPCIIFIKENSDDPKEFPKTDNFHFYACGDFGNSKKNDAVFGMNSDDPFDCIVEISNNDNPLCLFKTAIFENYQTNTTKDDDGNIIPVTNDVWDGDAVEFRYVNDGQEELLKEKVLRLWKWVYSVDSTKPGIKECFMNCSPVEVGDNVVFELSTNIPADYSTITSVAPNFLLACQQENSEGQLEWQTFSRFNIYDYIKLQPELTLAIDVTNVDGFCKITLTLPKYAVQFSDLPNINPGFFINFKNDYVLNDNFEYVLAEDGKKILDNEKYRLDKFKTEYTNYFEKQSLLFHYLFTERFTMIDNRAKNTFIHTNGNPNEGKEGNVWDYCFNYDDDTALGCNNKGFLTMDYGVEDTDDIHGNILTGDATPAFNAATSVIWKNVRTLKTDLIALFSETTSAWSATSLNNKFEKYQGYKCAQLQMLDMERKYFRPYFSGYYGDDSTSLSNYLPMLQGRKTYQRRRFQKYQEIYCESKYKNPEIAPTSDIFTFRSTLSGRTIQPEIVPYIKCYPVLKYDQIGAYSERVWPGQTFKPTGLSDPNDKNFVIYPSKYISELGGFSNAGLETANVSSGAKLLKVDFSNNPNLPEADADSISFGASNALLEEINISKTLAEAVDLTALTNLKTFNAEDTIITSIEFANGGLIREAKLGSSTKDLICINNSNLESLTIQKNENDEYALETIRINNPSKLMNWINLLDLSACPKLEEVNILNVDYEDNNCWSFKDNSWIEELYQLKDVTLTGNIYIDQIREHDYNKYLEKWPGLTIGHAAAFMPTYKISYYKDSSKQELLLEEIYDKDAKTVKPSMTPVKESDYQYTYEFLHWTADGLDGNEFIFGTALNKDTEIYAIYASKERKFTIRWYKDSTKTELLCDPKEYSYGEKAIYEGPELEPQLQTSGFSEYYNLFEQWSDSTVFVEEDLDVYAKWMNGSVDNITDTKELNAAQLYTLIKTGRHVDYFSDDEGETSTFERIRIPLGSQLNYNNLNKYKVAIKDEKNEDIQFPLIFKGTQTEGIKTNINLFEGENGVNNDWTLFLDLQYMNDVAGTTLASCFNGRYGFQVKNTKNYPYIHYNTDEPTIGGSNTTNANTNTGALREVFVITHKGGCYNAAGEYQKPVLTVYSGMLNQLKPYKKVLVEPLTPNDVHSQPLVFGAQLKGATWVKSSIATGIVYGCEMWNKVLSDEDCMELVSWPREQAEFTAVSFGNLYDKEGNETNINLIAAQTTIAKVSYYTSSNMNPTSFADSNMQQWLDTRYWNAIPAVWRYLIKTPQITYTTKSSAQTLIDSKLYIPSVYELLASTSPETIYINEGRVIPLLGLRTDEGRLDRASGWEYNTRFTPGNPMVDIYPNTNGALKPDWVYPKEGQYEQPTENVLNGSIWLSGTQYQLYHHGFWVNWGEGALPLRSITSSSAFKALQYSGQNSYLGTPSVSTDSYYHPLPCFSI